MRNDGETETGPDILALANEGTAQLLEIVKIASGRTLDRIRVPPPANGLGYKIDEEEIGKLGGLARLINTLSEARANEKKSDDELNARVAKELKRLLAEADAAAKAAE